MENEELIKMVTEKANKWLTPAYDAETQAEVKKMLENPDKTDDESYFNPFLISNPYFTNNDWYYDIVARPKMQLINPSDGHTEHKIEKRYVAKRWKDDGYEFYRNEKK